jgi:hypothetical protein
MPRLSSDSLFGSDSTWGESELTGEAALARDRLVAQFNDKENIIKLVSIYADRHTRILEILGQLRSAYDLSVAQGVQLDAIGERLDQSRSGLDDETYRKILQLKAKLVVPAQGTAPQIQAILRQLLGPGRTITFTDAYPAHFLIIANDMTALEVEIFEPFLQQAKPGGVGAHFSHTLGALIVDDSQDPISPTGKIASSQGAGASTPGIVSSVTVF